LLGKGRLFTVRGDVPYVSLSRTGSGCTVVREERQKGGDVNEKDYLYDLLVHDLAGPLAVVATTVNNLLCKSDRYGALSETQKVCLERVQRNTQKAQGLLQDMLEVARSEENIFRGSPFLAEEVMREALLEVFESTDPQAREELSAAQSLGEWQKILAGRGIAVHASGTYATRPFFHDRRKVLQILRNLLSNALKYRSKKMSLSISGEQDLVVEVSNDGPGIPDRDREAIYKRFVRVNSSNPKDAPGLGLGLFCIKALVEGMKGDISLGSGEGYSTVFTVRIPSLQTGRDKEDS
jgi:signal transduction histidine kinase